MNFELWHRICLDVGDGEEDDPLRFAPSLVEAIRERPHQVGCTERSGRGAYYLVDAGWASESSSFFLMEEVDSEAILAQEPFYVPERDYAADGVADLGCY